MNETTLKTGTTTVGLVCKDSIILAADKRATAGHLIVDKKVKKVVGINDNIAVTIAGSVSEVQLLIKYLKAEIKLKEMRTNRPVTVKEAANLLSGMVYGSMRSYFPGIAHFLLAGSSDGKVQLFDIFPDGSITLIDDFVSSGSGSVIAYGVLEASYKANMTQDQGIDLAVKAINSAIQRDSASGQGIDVVAITKDSVKDVFNKLVQTSITK